MQKSQKDWGWGVSEESVLNLTFQKPDRLVCKSACPKLSSGSGENRGLSCLLLGSLPYQGSLDPLILVSQDTSRACKPDRELAVF